MTGGAEDSPPVPVLEVPAESPMDGRTPRLAPAYRICDREGDPDVRLGLDGRGAAGVVEWGNGDRMAPLQVGRPGTAGDATGVAGGACVRQRSGEKGPHGAVVGLVAGEAREPPRPPRLYEHRVYRVTRREGGQQRHAVAAGMEGGVGRVDCGGNDGETVVAGEAQETILAELLVGAPPRLNEPLPRPHRWEMAEEAHVRLAGVIRHGVVMRLEVVGGRSYPRRRRDPGEENPRASNQHRRPCGTAQNRCFP